MLAALAEEYGVALNLYTATGWHVRRTDEHVELEARHCGVSPRVGLSWQQLADPIVKVMYIGPAQAVAEIRARIEPLSGQLTPTSTYYGEYLDVGLARVSKGIALDALMRHLDLTPEQVMAVGGGENDVPMLTGAGVSVALRDGHPALVEVATHLTVGCEHGAVATAVNGLIFGDPEARARLWQSLPVPATTSQEWNQR